MSASPEFFPARVAEYIRKNHLISAGDHVLVAVSGGPDSIALLSVLIDLRNTIGIERITVAHFDHGLRGAESANDMEFVRTVASSAGVDFRCGEADVRAHVRSRKISIEMAGRECRRAFFIRTASELHACRIALGHTADDQAEEVVMRILRGTGPEGIQGMSPLTEEGIIRPFLFVTRDEVLAYLKERGIVFRIDSTNLSPWCQRNFLRLKVFPLLRSAFHPRIAQTVSRCAYLAREEESWWTSQILDLWDRVCLASAEGRYSLDFGRLRQLHPALLRRVLRFAVCKLKGDLSGVGFVHLEPLIEAVYSDKAGKPVRIHAGIQARREGTALVISQIESDTLKDPPGEPIQIYGPGNCIFGEFDFEFRFCDGEGSRLTPDPDADRVRMDSDKLLWPLELRFLRPGDRFRPLGMTGTKKLQDFFVDCKVPRAARKKVPLLCDGEKICWVAGMRMDERVRVEAQSKKILMVRIVRRETG